MNAAGESRMVEAVDVERSFRRAAVICAAALLLCPGLLSVRAEAQSGSWILPSSAFSTGAGGALFQTDVRLLNLGSTSVTVTGTFYDQSNGQTYTSPSFPIVARNQASYDNVLQSLFGRGLGSYGPIRFQSSGPITVSSSVNNVNACGSGATSGQWLPGIEATQALRKGALGHLALSASSASGYRTNVVFMNPGTSSTTVNASLRRGGGALVGSMSAVTLGANGFRQVGLASFPGASGLTDTNLYLEFSSEQPVISFASVINNASGDPFAIVATADPGGDGREEVTYTLPGGVPLVLVRIPAGTFQMGAPESERYSNSWERPVHSVTLTTDYYLGKYEVTQAQWQAVMGSFPSYFGSCGGSCPVEQVSWDDIRGANGFIAKLNQLLGTTKFRLPTEAEWERAARGGTQTRFSFGDALGGSDGCYFTNAEAEPYVWWCLNSGNKTHAVGTKKGNPYGLFDIHGNVWEWVEDWWADDYLSAGSTNPTGPSTGSSRVIRGGAWDNGLDVARSAHRYFLNPSTRFNNFGFRLARSL